MAHTAYEQDRRTEWKKIDKMCSKSYGITNHLVHNFGFQDILSNKRKLNPRMSSFLKNQVMQKIIHLVCRRFIFQSVYYIRYYPANSTASTCQKEYGGWSKETEISQAKQRVEIFWCLKKPN